MEELTQDGAQLARTMLMSAAQLTESMARVQAQRAWIAQSRATAQAAQAQQQIAAERDAARVIFRPLTDDRYWQNAPQLDRVVQAYVAAASWAERDLEAHAAVQLIKQHAEQRWGRALGEAMHEPAKQRKLLADLGIEPRDGLTNAQASDAIRERLQVSSLDGTPRHHTEVAETVFVEGIARQADDRLTRLTDQVMAAGGAVVDAETQAARGQSDPAIAQPIEQSLQAARPNERGVQVGDTTAPARSMKLPESHNPIRSRRHRETLQPGPCQR